jgi:lipopolysaccharide export system permease protein
MGLTLKSGSIQLSTGEVDGRYRLATFADYSLSFDLGRGLTDPMQRTPGEQELTLTDLLKRAATLRTQGQNYHPPLVEFHKKLAIPVSCALFILVGVPLGSRIRRGGRGLSLAISVAFALGYYILIVAGEALGDRGLMPEAVAMWLPNILIALGGGLLLVRAEIQPANFRQALALRAARAAGTPRS